MAFDLFDRRAEEGPFKILTVCTGNVCRSPLAEVLLRTGLSGLPVEVTSAGTQALVGEPMTKRNLAIAKRFSADDPLRHVARQLRVEHLEEADLVLALSRSHRREAVEMLPKVSQYVFTLREFGRLAESLAVDAPAAGSAGDSGARMREAARYIAQMRGTIPPAADLDGDNVVDPYMRSEEVYEESAAQIVPAVESTVRLLRRATGNE